MPPYLVDRQRRVNLHSKNCEALILAGGVGNRLKPLTSERCKPAVSFGAKYRIIDFTLSNCLNSGIRSVGVITQYKSWELGEHIRRAWGHLRGEFGDTVSLMPAEQTEDSPGWYLGTADSVYQNLSKIEARGCDYVMVLSGDHIYKMDYNEMLEAHIRNQADITVGTIPVPIEDANRFGVVESDNDGRITRFLEKPANPPSIPGRPEVALASMGIYIFSRKKLTQMLVEDHHNELSKHDFGMDILPKACAEGKVMAFQFGSAESGVQNYWRDVGTIDAYYEANMDLIHASPELNLYDTFWPIWTYQESAPPAKFTFNDQAHGKGRAYDSLVSAGCMVIGSEVDRSILFPYVTINEQSKVEDCLLLPHVTIGKGCTIRRAIIEENCKIPDGMQIGVDLELDGQRFKLTESGLVVITPQMLQALAVSDSANQSAA